MNTKSKRHASLGLAALVSLSSCAAPLTSTRIARDVETSNSVYYSLPRTDLVVSAELLSIETKTAKCTELNKAVKAYGPQSAREVVQANPKEAPPNSGLWQAYINAGLNPQKLEPAVPVEVGQSGFAVTTRARPDPDQVFAIKLEGKAGHDRKTALVLAIDGLLAGGNVSAVDRGGEIAASVVVEVLSAVATIAGSFFGATKVAVMPEIKQRPNVDEALQRRPEFDLCYRALERLSDLNKDRGKLIDGTMARLPTDIADQLRILDDERARIERLFTGEKEIRKGAVRCVVDPGNTPPEAPIPLWSLNEDKGIKLDAEGCVVTPGFETQEPGKPIALKLSTDNVNRHAETVSSSHRPGEKPSPAVIYYRVPGRATVTLVEEATKVRFGPELMTIAQFGVVLPLPVPTGNKKVEVAFKVDPQTGALVEVGVATGGDSSAIPNIGKTAEAVGSLGATIVNERDYTDSERVKDMFVEACIEALDRGEWATACEAL